MQRLRSIDEAAGDLHQCTLSPRELVDECLDRIERLEPRLHAWTLVDAENARAAADQCGREIAAGCIHGPLHGIPVGIKDLVDVAGWPTRAGSPMREDHVAKRDAPLVERLRQAGAILLGKTVTTEFACFDPPATRNPWNPSRTPGGSSSGSAAAVAVGMCLGAIGSQTGGSITRPASYCGVAGCKPTLGLISTEGCVPVSFHLDHPGPIARRVADLAIMMETLTSPSQGVAPAYRAQLDAGHRPRLGVLEDYFFEKASPEIRALTTDAIQRLRSAGATVRTLHLPPGFADSHRMHRRIMAVEAAEAHRETYPARIDEYAPTIRALLQEGHDTPLLDYAEAIRFRESFQRSLPPTFADVDAVLIPATTTTAPGPETTGDPSFNSPWSYSGVPVVSLPCGLAADGLPGAIQLVGPLLSEATLLATAAWCERVFNFDHLPSLLSGD